MIRIETRGTNVHGDTYSIVIEDDITKFAIDAYQKIVGEVKFGDIVIKVPSKGK
jgi:hypothetical protein